MVHEIWQLKGTIELLSSNFWNIHSTAKAGGLFYVPYKIQEWEILNRITETKEDLFNSLVH